MLIGVFALPEILIAIESRARGIVQQRAAARGENLTFAEFRRCLRTIWRSTAIGTSVGVIPGVGQVVAAFMGYAAAKSASSTAGRVSPRRARKPARGRPGNVPPPTRRRLPMT